MTMTVEEFLEHISEKPWGDYTSSDYSIEQWHKACLIHIHQAMPTSKSQCKLPVKTPNGAVNRNGVHAAAAALAGARGGVNASSEQKASAKRALRGLYNQLNENPPPSLQQGVQMDVDEIGIFLEYQGMSDAAIDQYFEHHGVKGQKWGVRKQQRLERTQRVAEGTGSFTDKRKVLGNQSAIGLIRGKGLKGAAKNQTIALEALKKRTLEGNATTRDMLNNIGGVQLFSVGSTGGSGKSKSASAPKISKEHVAKNQDVGHAVARVALAGAGGYLIGRGISHLIINS